MFYCRRYQFCIVTLLSSLCIVAGCSKPNAETTEESSAGPPAPRPALVRVQSVRAERIAPRLIAVGTVHPRHTSIIASAAEGVVDEFPVEEGSFVKAETVLSRLRMFSTDLALDEERAILAEKDAQFQQTLAPRKEDVEEAKAIQAAADTALRNADRQLKELQSLISRGATNESAVKDAEDAFSVARHRSLAADAVFGRVAAGVREEEKLQAKARLDAQTTHVAWLEAEKEKRITRAPFDGFILREETYLGQWLSKGDPVVRMARLDEVHVRVPVDQSFISQVVPGTTVHLKIVGTPDSTSDDGRWTGTVHSIIPRSEWETGSRSFPVIVAVTNRMTGSPEVPVPALREGMMAEVEFFGTEFEATMVPKDSLVRTSRGTLVFAVNAAEDGQPLSVRQVGVEPGISQEEWIQIRSDLSAGMQVVTEGAERLRPFQSVSILEEPIADSASAR